MSSLPTLSTPTAGSATKTNAVSARPVAGPAPAAPPAETSCPPAVAPPASALRAGVRSLRAAAIRSRDWRSAWLLALRQPAVATFEGLAAHPAASLERALRWCLAAAVVGSLLPAGLSLLRGTPVLTLLPVYAVLVALSVGAFAAGTAVACALAAHLSAYGLGWRPQLSARRFLGDGASPAGTAPSVFQRAVYDRLAFACAAYAAPLFVALGAVVVAPALLRGLLLLAFTLYAGLLTVLAVRAACKVSWAWALVAGVAGVLCALLPLAAVAGAWAGLTG